MSVASRVNVLGLVLIVIGLAVVASLPLKSPPKSPLGYFLTGCAVGTLFGQTTIAAFWTVLGSPPLHRRVLWSLIWLILLLVAIAISVRFESPMLSIVPMIGTAVGTQWIL